MSHQTATRRPSRGALVTFLAALSAFASSAAAAPAPQTSPADCASICDMEVRCKTITVGDEGERRDFCLKNCTAPLFDPDFRDCLATAADCEAFAACAQRFKAEPSVPQAAGTLFLADDASLPTSSCPGTSDCTYPEVCCTQIYGAGGHGNKVHLCGQRDCPEPECLEGGDPFCAWCGCPTKSSVYPDWPPKAAGTLGLTSLGKHLVLAYKTYAANQRLVVSTSTNGTDFSDPTSIPKVTSTHGPGLTTLNGHLVIAYKRASGRKVAVVTSADGQNFSDPVKVRRAPTQASPAITTFGGQLRIAFVGRHSRGPIYLVSSTDGRGIEWGDKQQISGAYSRDAPALAEFKGKLFEAHSSRDDSTTVVVSRSSDLSEWSFVVVKIDSTAAPALATFKDRLFLAVDSGGSRGIAVVSSADGFTFDTANARHVGSSASEGPALATLGSRLYLTYKSGDGSNELMISSTADGTTWTSPTTLSGQTTP